MTWATLRRFSELTAFQIYKQIEALVADRMGWSPSVWDRRPMGRSVSRARKLVAMCCRYHGLTLDEIGRWMGCTRQAVHYQCRTFDPDERELVIYEEVKGL